MEYIEIKKGEKFKCIQKIPLRGDDFTVGVIYECSVNNHLLSNRGKLERFFSQKFFDEFFVPIDKTEYKANASPFVYYRGVHGRGNEILKILKDLEGQDMCFAECENEDYLYFITPEGTIDCVQPSEEEWVVKHYIEGHLPKIEKPEFGLFDKVLYLDRTLNKWQPAECRDILDANGDVKICVKQLIPYNEETKHLAYQTMDCPDKYKD